MQWLESVEQYGFDRIIDAMRSYCDWVSSGHPLQEAFLVHTQWLQESQSETPMIRELQEGLEQLGSRRN